MRRQDVADSQARKRRPGHQLPSFTSGSHHDQESDERDDDADEVPEYDRGKPGTSEHGACRLSSPGRDQVGPSRITGASPDQRTNDPAAVGASRWEQGQGTVERVDHSNGSEYEHHKPADAPGGHRR